MPPSLEGLPDSPPDHPHLLSASLPWSPSGPCLAPGGPSSTAVGGMNGKMHEKTGQVHRPPRLGSRAPEPWSGQGVGDSPSFWSEPALGPEAVACRAPALGAVMEVGVSQSGVWTDCDIFHSQQAALRQALPSHGPQVLPLGPCPRLAAGDRPGGWAGAPGAAIHPPCPTPHRKYTRGFREDGVRSNMESQSGLLTIVCLKPSISLGAKLSPVVHIAWHDLAQLTQLQPLCSLTSPSTASSGPLHVLFLPPAVPPAACLCSEKAPFWPVGWLYFLLTRRTT